MNETELLTDLKLKKIHALEKIIAVYTPYLNTVLFNMAGSALSKEDAEEIISETFAVLWNQAEMIDSKKGGIKSYIAGTAKKQAAMKLRKKTFSYVPIEDTELPYEDTALEDCINQDQAFNLWKAVAELGEPDNEIFLRYYKYDQKIREIAKNMCMKEATVKIKLFRGKKKLKERLTERKDLL